MKKYSIIIPARNGGAYLPTCLKTILEQDYSDYELILSDDHSTDDTKSFLKTLKHPNLRVVEPPEGLSMTEHWEWALSQASGQWLIFVGQDDGLQSYFFRLADQLTDMADRKGLRSIMSNRAYHFWKGCEFIYGDVALNYRAARRFCVRDFRWQTLKVLTGAIEYFELPEMYTTALFHRSLLADAQARQGRVFTAHPQDANLAAIACSLEKKYLHSAIPLGWVGTSPRSAGMAVSATGVEKVGKKDREDLERLKVEYKEKVLKSKLPYHPLAGDFTYGSMILYFWQALLQTAALRGNWVNRLLLSKGFRTILLGCVLSETRRSARRFKKDQAMLQEILDRNACSFFWIRVSFFAVEIWRGLTWAPAKLKRVWSKLTCRNNPKCYSLQIPASRTPPVELQHESMAIAARLAALGWFQDVVRG